MTLEFNKSKDAYIPQQSRKAKEIVQAQDRKTAQIKLFRDETEYNILIGQAVNIASDKSQNKEELFESSRLFVKYILELRQDHELRQAFIDYKKTQE